MEEYKFSLIFSLMQAPKLPPIKEDIVKQLNVNNHTS